MCFSVNVNLVRDEIETRYNTSFPDRDRYQPSYYYHAFSLPLIPAICPGSPGIVKLLRWGLIPSWIRNADDAKEIRYKTFNARAETVSSKPSYSKSFKSRRCIIPVKGFFEWQHAGNEKIPWYIWHTGEEIFSIAGLYDSWVETNTGETLDTFSIITTEANELLAVIHNSKKRMPVILDREGENRWISTDTSPEEALSLLKPCPAEILGAHTISDLVNNQKANRNSPEVIQPYQRGTSNLLF